MIGPTVSHSIDRLWCDVYGVYVAGWAHADAVAVTSIMLSSGDAVTQTDRFTDRPDVAEHFANPNLTAVGFALYLPCEPFRPVVLTIVTCDGSVDLSVTAPPAPPPADQDALPAPIDTFISAVKAIGGTVVEIGARVVGPASTLQASLFEPECRHVGVDIHAADGVDVVVDAHQLSTAFAPGSITGVFSIAVMEHLAMPWVIAAEINTILAPGGLVYHVLPQSFPVHEMPNDFWRMTDEALKVLYGPATGFEVIEAGMLNPVQIYLRPALRVGAFLEMPLHDGMATAYIIARKARTIAPDAVRWPMGADIVQAQSLRYPTHR